MKGKLKESDWKTFRSIVPELRERYLTEKNKEIVAIFMDEGRTPTERFWDAKKRIEADHIRTHTQTEQIYDIYYSLHNTQFSEKQKVSL